MSGTGPEAEKMAITWLVNYIIVQQYNGPECQRTDVLGHLIRVGMECRILIPALSKRTAHSTIYHHLSQQSSCIETAQQSLSWRYTVDWAIFSESVHSPKFIPIQIGIPSWIPNLGWNSKLNTDLNWNSKLNSWSVGRECTWDINRMSIHNLYQTYCLLAVIDTVPSCNVHC